nr:hypothetical protein Iba_chr14dCG4320 [Ipomoea batatas]
MWLAQAMNLKIGGDLEEDDQEDTIASNGKLFEYRRVGQGCPLEDLEGLYSEDEQKTSTYLGLKTGFYNDDEVKAYWREIWDDEVAWDAARSHAKHISKNAHKTVLAVAGRTGAGWARRRCGSWAGLRWLGVAAMAGRGGAGEADVRSGEARWRCVGEARWTCGGGGEAVEVRRPVAVRGWKSGQGCEASKQPFKSSAQREKNEAIREVDESSDGAAVKEAAEEALVGGDRQS